MAAAFEMRGTGAGSATVGAACTERTAARTAMIKKIPSIVVDATEK
jgi:hypothetical protein